MGHSQDFNRRVLAGVDFATFVGYFGGRCVILGILETLAGRLLVGDPIGVAVVLVVAVILIFIVFGLIGFLTGFWYISRVLPTEGRMEISALCILGGAAFGVVAWASAVEAGLSMISTWSAVFATLAAISAPVLMRLKGIL